MSLTVEQVLARYGIVVRDFPEDKEPSGIKTGPRLIGLLWPNTVVADAHELKHDPAGVLHEGMHLVCASRESDIDEESEEDALLQVEYAVARVLSARDRREVDKYRADTFLDIPGPKGDHNVCVGDYDRPRATAWWREGFKRAVKLGLLTADGRPTWVRRKRRRA